MRARNVLVSGWGCVCLWMQVVLLAAADPQLGTIASPAPDPVSAGIRAALSSQGIEVARDGKVRAQFWLRGEVPLKDSASGALGVSFGRLQPGTLLGVVGLPEAWSDYKGQPVPPGVYTLRYGLQPADGNHMGVTFYRDFLLLIPASADTALEAPYQQDELLELSKKSSGTTHPTVLALFPAGAEEGLPRLARNELEQWVVEVRAGALSLGLVVEGKGEVEGY